MQEIIKGRVLQLNGLENARNKVTLGFKVEGGTKIQLAQEANKMGMTLSEYVDTVISHRHNLQKPVIKEVVKEVTKEIIKPDLETQRKFAESLNQNQILIAKINFYENDILKRAFEINRGKQFPIKNNDGTSKEIKINQIQDVYTVLLNSVKLQ
jgi:hypothetical protein